MACGTPSLCRRDRAWDTLWERFESGGRKPSSEAVSLAPWPRTCWQGRGRRCPCGTATAAPVHRPEVAGEAGERGSGDRDRAPLRPLPQGLLATTRSPPGDSLTLEIAPPTDLWRDQDEVPSRWLAAWAPQALAVARCLRQPEQPPVLQPWRPRFVECPGML